MAAVVAKIMTREEITPREIITKNSNRAVLCTTVVCALQSPAFRNTIFRPQEAIVPYSIVSNGYEAYALIDTRDLAGEPFVENLSRAIENVALRVPASIKGEMNDRAELDEGGFRFHFAITGRWIDSPFEPPPETPEGRERLLANPNCGRTLNIKIGFAV